ncbi:unnamed protein product [Meloidogyne enterolobii]|uniref:Uncharacterized protein n=2 Tax=Meloidogyne enterolobii TaxID=390850 RepID=A0ACB1AMU2_MELEN|nr:unnamed protein product [Meloidogyne enterolobii]
MNCSFNLFIALGVLCFLFFGRTIGWCGTGVVGENCRNSQCVCDKSWKWKKAVKWNVNALWYVCKFADDAERNCKAHWDGCLKKYVSTRAAFQSVTSWFRSPENAGWDAAINAGWNGYKYGKCDYLLKQ